MNYSSVLHRTCIATLRGLLGAPYQPWSRILVRTFENVNRTAPKRSCLVVLDFFVYIHTREQPLCPILTVDCPPISQTKVSAQIRCRFLIHLFRRPRFVRRQIDCCTYIFCTLSSPSLELSIALRRPLHLKRCLRRRLIIHRSILPERLALSNAFAG